MQTPHKPQKVPPKQKKVQVDVIDQEFHEAAVDLANIIAEEEAAKPNQVLSKKALEERFQKELENGFATYRKRLENGAFQVMKALNELSKRDSAMTSIDVLDDINRLAGISRTIAGKEAEFFEESEGDISLQEIAKVSSATMEKMYLAAKYLYDQQQFKEAADAFGFLTALNADNHAFWLGLGNSEYLCKNYEEALYALAFACQANPDDPNCHIISCRCYEELGEKDNAINALDLAIFVIGDRPEYAQWQAKIKQEKVRLAST
jgi:type III secretion system low calcium response chaperone LcrH/SycD